MHSPVFVQGHIANNLSNSEHSLATVPLWEEVIFSIPLLPYFPFILNILLKPLRRESSDSPRILLITVGTDCIAAVSIEASLCSPDADRQREDGRN